jgi:hypothetical protein
MSIESFRTWVIWIVYDPIFGIADWIADKIAGLFTDLLRK